MPLEYVQKLGTAALDFCFPPRCMLCQQRLEPDEHTICQDCRSILPWTGTQCLQQGVHFQTCISPLYYTDVIRPSFHRYKFRGSWHYSHVYGGWMWDYLRQYDPDYSRFDCITWTPLSVWRYLRRGYNQARRLAEVVAENSGLPLQPTLVKIRHTPPQSGTAHAEERWENVRGAYGPRPNVPLAGKRILIVDDVITTGATLEEACRVLREQGAEEVCCLTLARGLSVRAAKRPRTEAPRGKQPRVPKTPMK